MLVQQALWLAMLAQQVLWLSRIQVQLPDLEQLILSWFRHQSLEWELMSMQKLEVPESRERPRSLHPAMGAHIPRNDQDCDGSIWAHTRISVFCPFEVSSMVVQQQQAAAPPGTHRKELQENHLHSHPDLRQLLAVLHLPQITHGAA
jgi:hypothetical protein